MLNIAIDGPSGAGKSTVARAVAERLHIIYVDTGALYRSIGLYMVRNGISLEDSNAIAAALPEVNLSMRHENGEQHILLGGEDVGDAIRTPDISMAASAVSKIPAVREFLLETQRSLARTQDVIMDGRDIGTVILPDATVKIFMTAGPEARARRRVLELQKKGIDATYEEVLADMQARDEQDRTRDIAPAVAAPDAVLLDNSDLTFDETVEAILGIIREKTDTDRKRKKTDGAAEAQQQEEWKREQKRLRRYARMRRLIGGFCRFFLRLHAEGLENIPETGGVMLCANHLSVRDVFAIGAVCPRPICFLAKKELFSVPVIGRIIAAMGACRLDRGGRDIDAIRRSVAILNNGQVFAIFPQGTRHPGENPADTPVKNGAGLILYRADAPVVPVSLVMKDNRYRLFRRVNVVFGEPIPREALGFTRGGSKEYAAATQKVFAAICRGGGWTPTALPDADATQEDRA